MDEPSAVSVTTTLLAKAGCEDRLETVLADLARAVRAGEPGCLLYAPLRSRHERGRFLVLERYRDDAALADHANAEHFRAAFGELMECLVVPPSLALFDDVGRGS